MSQWIQLDKYNSEAEARVVQSKLDSLGITSQLLGSHSRAAGPEVFGLRLMIQSEDLQKAQEALVVVTEAD